MKLCSSCKTNEPRNGQRTCKACHNNYMKDWNAKKAEAKKVSHETSPAEGQPNE